MDRQNPNILPDKIISWWDIARGIGDVVFHGIFDQLRHEGLSSHGHNDDIDLDPVDTLATPPQMYTPGWTIDARSREIIYADPLHHIEKMTNRWDDMGDWSDRSEVTPPDEAA